MESLCARRFFGLTGEREPQAQELSQQFGQTEGENTFDSYFGGLKWAWFCRNEPDLYGGTWKILQANSYIVYHLTGEVVMDFSQAGLCSPCFSLAKHTWDETFCERIGLVIEKLPTVVPSAQVVGTVHPTAAQASGIPAGTPVLCGAGDFACACLGAGVMRPGTAVMMLGTAGNLLVPATLKTDPRLLNTLHVNGQTLSLGGVMAGGAVNWISALLGKPFQQLDTEAEQVSAGADGLIFLPYLMGERTPIWDANARGVFLGLAAHHQSGHLFRAVLEGVAFAYRQMAEILNESGSPLKEVIAVDGGAKSALWRQIFADVLEIPVCWRPKSGGTLLGAAYLAAIAMGEEKGFEGILNWCDPTINTLPNPGNQSAYRQAYTRYRQIYGRVKDLF